MFCSKVVLITGSSSGIGAQLSRSFAKEGASLVVTGRNKENLAKVANECRSLGADKVLEIATDLILKENMEMVMKDTIEKFGKLDVLINNAGQNINGSIRDVTLEVYDQIMNINLRTPLFMTQIAIPHLEKTKGCIINMSSMFSTTGNCSEAFSYAISKAGLQQFTKLTALDLAKSGIRVNALRPGFVETPMVMGYTKLANIKMEEVGRSHPLNGRMVKTQEIADAALFLASDKAKMITGVALPVDGALLLKG